MENPKGWGGGVLFEIPSVVGVWIFSGTTHSYFLSNFEILLVCIPKALVERTKNMAFTIVD